ncbi:MAG: hypothetical protein CSB13_09175 [Chloroflexi bacterium]|nr:MAG: hypothetical protein CSB13_09175 [Chloroflexota bacterium]
MRSIVGQSEEGKKYYYENGVQHVFAELECIDLYIQYYLSHIQSDFNRGDQYRGLYISESDIQLQFSKPIGEPWWSLHLRTEELSSIISFISERRSSIAKAVFLSHQYGVDLQLEALQQRFGLKRVEVDIILIALAVNIDLRYENVFAYLQDDINKKYLSVDLCLNILGGNAQERLQKRRYLSRDATLVKQELVELCDNPDQANYSFLGKVVNLPQRIVDFLLGNVVIESRIRGLAQVVNGNTCPFRTCFDLGLKERLTKIAEQFEVCSEPCVISIKGKSGSGKKAAALFLAQEVHYKLLAVDLRQLMHVDLELCEEKLALIHREALLQKAVIYFHDTRILSGDDGRTLQSVLLRYLSGTPNGLVVLAGQDSFDSSLVAGIKNYIQYDVGELSALRRAQIWRSHLIDLGLTMSDEEIVSLADRFRFTQGQIHDSINTACQITAARGSSPEQIDIEVLYHASRLNSNSRLGKLARQISPKYAWSDITLEADTFKQLEELYSTVKHHARVLEEWGFDEKLSVGKGVNALFSGPPGTGKTMAAEIIAKSLGLDLYKIDLSLVVSKYIGETEKNLSMIFHEAETSNAILFFDEADALFGKRTEVKSSHDRHANVEVAYLLQKMEDYTGITIMATNLRRNIDDAFTRRLAFVVDFPFPDVDERLQIWKNVWPEGAPLDVGIDFEFLANNFRLAGGNIKNIALAASFLAAEARQSIGMKHLLAATRREFEKQGRTFVQNDYGKYSYLLEAV